MLKLRGAERSYQISSILPIKCHDHHFLMSGVVTNSWISHKLIFHVVIPHEFQCGRKMMKHWWLLIHLSIPNECHEIQEFGSFFRPRTRILKVSRESSAPVKCHSQYHRSMHVGNFKKKSTSVINPTHFPLLINSNETISRQSMHI